MSESPKGQASGPLDGLLPTREWTDALARLGRSLSEMIGNPPDIKHAQRYDPAAIYQAIASVGTGLVSQQAALLDIQLQTAQDLAKLWATPFLPPEQRQPVIEPVRGDGRFRDSEWNDNPLFDQFKQTYLVASRTLRALVEASPEQDPQKRAITGFVVDQFLNAVSPTNFVATNPQALRRTIDTGGANLVAGFANLIEDLAEGKGIVRRRAASVFTLGKDLACTPGGVVYENDLMQLIQYTPTTAKVARRPLLYVPPLVNKYYMIDLQPKSSLIRWLVEQGHTVFVVSWVDPDESHRHCEIDDYIGRGVIEAMDTVRAITGEPDVDLFGFCMGGTLIAIADAVLAARGEGNRIGSSTLIGSLVDFGDMRVWSGFLHESHVNALDSHVKGRGYISKEELQQLFALVRSNDLIWSSFVDHYLLDRDAPASDLLFWFEDGAHIPEAFLSSYNRKLLVDNHLTEPGKVEMLGQKLDLGKVTSPLMIVALMADHVSAWEAVYTGRRYFGGPVEFILGGSGHNAGVINPPAANKHGYWTNPDLSASAEDWLKAAAKHDGSWWPRWAEWLKANQAHAEVPARALGAADYPVLEEAPGRFILAGNS